MIITCVLSFLILLWFLDLIKFDKLRQIFKNRESNYFEQHFTFIREIGKGGYGEVLEVKSIDKQSYAIKKTFLKSKSKFYCIYKYII
jgi:serine/threonine protein kinase